MTASPLADLSRDIPALDRWHYRESEISGFGIHHNAGVNAFGQATAPGREVSANYWITTEGDILPNVDEEYRAFTSGETPAGRAADHRNITVEVSNSPEGVRNGTWAISSAAQEALSALIADVYRRYGLGPVLRGADRGIGIHSDWVQTECPGGYIRANLGNIIARAEALRVNGGLVVTPDTKEWYEMLKPFNLKSLRTKAQKITGDGTLKYVKFRDKWSKAASDRTLVNGPGHVVGLNVNVAAKAEKGTRAVFYLVKETGEDENREVLAGPVRAVADEFGIGKQLGYTGKLGSKDLIRLLVQVQSGKSIEISASQLYWNGDTA